VIIADRDASRLEAVAKGHQGASPLLRRRKEAEVRHLIAEAERQFGPVDVFFSNAGIGRGGHEGCDRPGLGRQLGDPCMAHVYAARALVPGMLARKSGYLLNTASAAGLLASMGSAPYGVTKHAGVALAEHLAIQYGDRASRLGAVPAGGRHQHAAHGGRHRGVGRRRAQHRRRRADRDRGDGRGAFLILPHPR
jgi:NAD(P)-dependent dehydrogenase (short-subunit alcohol dehydrogenase family)